MKLKERAALAATNGHCWYCGVLLLPSASGHGAYNPDWFVLDHVVPKSAGGTNDSTNLVASCWRCNGIKGTSTLEQFRLRLAKKLADIPYFTPAQIEWLESKGFVMPVFEPVVFWGESQAIHP